MKSMGPRVRHLRRIPLRMIIGRLLQEFRLRWERPRLWRQLAGAAPPNVVDFDGPQLRRFAQVFQVQGARFEGDLRDLKNGVFVSNGIRRDFGEVQNFRWGPTLQSDPSAIRLEHDLAYFSFAIPLLRDCEDGASVVAELIAALEKSTDRRRVTRGFEWSPIALAQRVMALSTGMALREFPTDRDSYVTISRHLRTCANLLETSLESYLGFNHAVTTEMGLVVAHLSTQDRGLRRSLLNRLFESVRSSVLPDGTWAELSPAYHVHMQLLVQSLLAMGVLDDEQQAQLRDIERRMSSALSVLVHPDGEVAIFNDSATQDAVAPSLVGWRPQPSDFARVLPHAGFARLERSGISVMMDAGPLAPRSVAGHGHADYLAIEVCVGGRRFIIDPGVAGTAAGPDRVRTRSAALHNGPTLEGIEPAEFFGAWKVGRSATAQFVDSQLDLGRALISVSGASHDYAPNLEIRRTAQLGFTEGLTIRDEWMGALDSRAPRTRLLVVSPWSIESVDGQRIRFAQGSLEVTLLVQTGTVKDIRAETAFIAGPADPVQTTLIDLEPSSGLLVFMISSPAPRRWTSSPW